MNRKTAIEKLKEYARCGLSHNGRDLDQLDDWIKALEDNHIIRLSQMEIQSAHNRVAQAEKLICQLPETHEGRNSWLMNYGTTGLSHSIRANDNEKRKEAGYGPRELTWNDDTNCLNGTR